jgi:rubrerythrin
MPARLSAADVLGIAQMMEKNGADFYRRAAELCRRDDEAKIFQSLAEMEESHAATFARMAKALSPRPAAAETADEEFESVSLYLNAVLDSDNLEGSRFARRAFTGEETAASLVLLGVDLEKETILYYLGMKDLFAAEADKKVIDEIVAEEKEHLEALVREYRGIKRSET